MFWLFKVKEFLKGGLLGIPFSLIMTSSKVLLFCVVYDFIIAPAYSKVRYMGSTFRPFVRPSIRPSTIYVKVLTL